MIVCHRERERYFCWNFKNRSHFLDTCTSIFIQLTSTNILSGSFSQFMSFLSYVEKVLLKILKKTQENNFYTVGVSRLFYQLFGYPKAKFGPLTMRLPHLTMHFTVQFLIWPKATRSLVTTFGLTARPVTSEWSENKQCSIPC